MPRRRQGTDRVMRLDDLAWNAAAAAFREGHSIGEVASELWIGPRELLRSIRTSPSRYEEYRATAHLRAREKTARTRRARTTSHPPAEPAEPSRNCSETRQDGERCRVATRSGETICWRHAAQRRDDEIRRRMAQISWPKWATCRAELAPGAGCPSLATVGQLVLVGSTGIWPQLCSHHYEAGRQSEVERLRGPGSSSIVCDRCGQRFRSVERPRPNRCPPCRRIVFQRRHGVA